VKHIELLAPAGSLEALDAAIGEGADAVYLGLRSFNARMRTTNFAYSQFEGAVDALHKNGKKIYVTVNTVFEQREADRLYQLLKYLNGVKPDGLIVQDLGTIQLAHENFPNLDLHASTQLNVASAKGANFLSKYGVSRVVVARELSIEEIRAIKANCNSELEVFVHGALCMSYSGLCMFSSYLGGKSANRGTCAQACRRLYETEDKTGFFFSPDDLQLIDFVPDMIDAGVSSLKIEGRMKSAEYVGTVVAAYRHFIDNCQNDRERALIQAKQILSNDFARRKTSYFMGKTQDPDFLHPDQAGGTGLFLGKVREVRILGEDRYFEIQADLNLDVGDSVRIHARDDSGRETAKVINTIKKEDVTLISLTGDAKQGDTIYLTQTKSMSRRFKSVLPNSLSPFKRMPGMDKAPLPEKNAFTKDSHKAFPPGLYAQVSRVQDLFTLQAVRPEKAILCFNRRNAELFARQEKTAPFRKKDLIFSLDPFFPESDSDWLTEQIEYFAGLGYKNWMANNVGHIPLLRNKDLNLIAGPYLYAFNAYSGSLIQNAGFQFAVPPFEISKQNLQRVSELMNTEDWFITVFAYPALFRIRADLSKKYNFRFFQDKENLGFELVSDQDGSVVIPGIPFSLTDRIAFLEKYGFQRFILDFSWINLKKPLYKEVMQSAQEGNPLPDTSRFNWKDGFWNPEEPKN